MRYLILAAGQGNSSFVTKEQIPKCLIEFDGITTIDRIINFSRNNSDSEVCLVGGFEILKIMSKYPQLRYLYNEEWNKTGSLMSLLLSFDLLDDDLMVVYSDVAYDDKILSKTMLGNRFSLQFDSQWINRYANRDASSVEIIYDQDGSELGEFTGSLFIPKRGVKEVKKIATELTKLDNSATLLDLVHVIVQKYPVEFIDTMGAWAELDANEDINKFVFGTKSETLDTIQKVVCRSKILDQYTFQVEEYEKDKQKIIDKIQATFSSKFLILRSSALNEDTHNSSMAGNYESVLRVPTCDKKSIEDAIESVVISYLKSNQKQNKKNQVLVQEFLDSVTMSGVVFTKDLQTDSPYYKVNYNMGNDTESVTSGKGKSLKTFVCYKNFTSEIYNKKIAKLISAIQEIEAVTNFDAIDVEFAFVDEDLYVLQVRPIAARKDHIKVSEVDISNEIYFIKEYMKFNKSRSELYGKSTAYGVMPDWNPAEIIGISPKPLAYDLYSYLVTDNIWAESRKFLGYKDVGNNSGLVLFAGRPYVDVRMSFSSFIPKDIETHTADKLVETFILKLKNNPEHHDKVEFNIALTAFDFNFDDKLEELSSYGFGEQELQNISESYKELTQNIVLEKTTKIEKELAYSDILSRKRAVIFNSDISIFDKVFHLLEDCKKYGTLPFANLARMGFIGSILLKSLLSKNVIDKDEYEGLLGSVHSVATDFSNDFNLLLSKDLSKNEFLDKYGHLRPGTYEITSKSYNEGCDDYIDYKSEAVKQITDNNYKFSKDSLNKISEKIHQNGFDFSVETLLDFIKRSTEAREKSKFEFTKNLSMVLDLISEIGQEFNICRGDLSYLNLENILRNKNSSSRLDVESNLKVSIENNKKKYLVSSAIQLPELIFGNKDVEMFFYPESKPNYITHHIVSSEIVVLNKANNKKIDGKIVLIENADPGFDWIFSYRIKGLVTRYGGAASHMAIRCAEFDLPAAIGCGELFTSLEQCSKLEINCPNQKITGYQ